MFGQITQRLKEYFLLGLLTVGPLAITLWLFVQGFRVIDNLIPVSIKPFTGLGAILFFVIIILAGALTRTFLGNIFTTLSDSVLSKLPLVRTLYPLIKQVSHALLSGDSQSSFKRVVSVPLLGEHSRALAFVTGELPASNQLVLFVPTAPNPTSGYVVLYPRHLVEESPLSVEAAVKVIVSCGSSLSPKKISEKVPST